MTDFVSEIAIFHISLLMFVSVVYLSFWIYFFVVYEAINSIQTIGYYILFGVCGTNLLVIGPLALCILRKEIPIKPTVYRGIIFIYIILGVLSLSPTPLLSNYASGESTKEYLHGFFIEYGRAPYLMDYIHKAHQCCGFFDYTDYYQKPLESKDTFNEPVPKSCCSVLVDDCEKSPTIFKQGCFVHAGSKTPKGWVQPFQGTGFLSVLLIPLALPLFQLLPTCFLHDAIQILTHRRAKNLQVQDAELDSSLEQSQPPRSHLSRKTKTIKTTGNRRIIKHSASSTTYVDGDIVQGDTTTSVKSYRVKKMDILASTEILDSESTVLELKQQSSEHYQSEKRSSKNTAKIAARSGAHPAPAAEKEYPKPSSPAEIFLNVPPPGNDVHPENNRNEHPHAPEPNNGIHNNVQEPHVDQHNDNHHQHDHHVRFSHEAHLHHDNHEHHHDNHEHHNPHNSPDHHHERHDHHGPHHSSFDEDHNGHHHHHMEPAHHHKGPAHHHNAHHNHHEHIPHNNHHEHNPHNNHHHDNHDHHHTHHTHGGHGHQHHHPHH